MTFDVYPAGVPLIMAWPLTIVQVLPLGSTSDPPGVMTVLSGDAGGGFVVEDGRDFLAFGRELRWIVVG
jgi:hypothetical protein